MSEQNGGDVEACVEVVFALPDEQAIVPVPWVPGMTAGGALARSGLAERFSRVIGQEVVLGLNGEKVSPEHVLHPGDRVEICRPLRADPRQMRFEMVSGGKVMGGKPVRSD